MFDPEVAKADLEAVTGPVAKLAIVGTVRRERPGTVESKEEPAPLAVPLVRLARVAAIDVAAAFSFSGRVRDRVRWPLAAGPPLVPPSVMAARSCAGRLRPGGPASAAAGPAR